MWKLFHVCLLLIQPLTTKSLEVSSQEDIDLAFFLHFIRTYVCTGNNDWWKKISDPALRMTMQFGVLSQCTPKTDMDMLEVVRTLRTDSSLAMNEKNIRQKRYEVGECLWDTFKEWMLIPFFCPHQYEMLVDVLDGWLDDAHNIFCLANGKEGQGEIICTLTKLVLNNLQSITRKIGQIVHVCHGKNVDHNPALDFSTAQLKVRKRQYSTFTLINAIRKEICEALKMLPTYKFYLYSAKIGHGEMPLLNNAFCCWFRFLKD